MYPEELKNYKIILASKSPRRQYLLKELGLNFRVDTSFDVDEVFPSKLSKMEIPVYLAELKANAYKNSISENEILLTADTIVWLNGKMVGKPIDWEDAANILKSLSGNMHEVVTGVCLKSLNKVKTFTALSEVYFKPLDDNEINYYINNYHPFDKAGAYGVQEWIGYVGVEKIHGSYFNVMGLPIQKLYVELLKFIKTS
ncbi:MAG: septum formation protein Maf [Bacteroidales bacterium]|nr:septum formation protein Maf [Bacteroidales bacterium]